MVVSDYDLLTMIWLFHCLPDSAWAVANRTEIAEQLSKIVEFKTLHPQNVVADHHGHPVLMMVLSE